RVLRWNSPSSSSLTFPKISWASALVTIFSWRIFLAISGRLLYRRYVLRPGNDYPRRFRPGHFDNIAAATFLSNCSDTVMVSAIWHSLLNSGIDHDSDHLARSVADKQSPKGLLASVPRLPANQGSTLCSETLGTSQQPVLRWRK